MKLRAVGLAWVLCVSVLAGCATPLKQTLPETARVVPDGRQMIVSIQQNEINATIKNSNVAAATGGGLLMALIDAGVNQSHVKKAEEAIVPVRDALTDYKFDQKALAASDELALSVGWLSIKKTELNKDVSNARFSRALDESSSPQLVTITYDYLLGPVFESLTVGANLSVLSKKIPSNGKKEDRALLKNAEFSRLFICVVPLPTAGKEPAENVSKWAENGGAFAEQSLDKALAQLVVMMKKGLELTPEQAKALTSAKNTKVGNYQGKVVERDAEGTLLLSPLGQFQYIYGGFPN